MRIDFYLLNIFISAFFCHLFSFQKNIKTRQEFSWKWYFVLTEIIYLVASLFNNWFSCLLLSYQIFIVIYFEVKSVLNSVEIIWKHDNLSSKIWLVNENLISSACKIIDWHHYKIHELILFDFLYHDFSCAFLM